MKKEIKLKKICSIFIVAIMYFFVITNVCAATLTIEDVSDKFNESSIIEDFNKLEVSITSKVNQTDKTLDIYSENKKIFSFVYGDDYIEYDNRSAQVTQENYEESISDIIFMGGVMESVFILSGYENKTLLENRDYTDTYETYGIQIETDNYTFSGSDENGSSWNVSGDFLKYFKISLDTDKIDALIDQYGEDIVGDSNESPEKAWDSFVKYFKNVEFYLGENISKEDIIITNDERSLTIKVIDEEKTYVTKYLYENGIITYSQKGNRKYDDDFNNQMLIYFRIKHDYEFNKFYNYIYSAYPSNNWTIEKNGIEGTMEPLYTEEEEIELQKELDKYLATLDEQTKKDYIEDGLDKVFNPLIFSELKIDLVNGFKNYDESKIAYYNIIDGAFQKYIVGKTENLIVRSDGEFNLFGSVYVDDKLVDKKYYEVKEGSTIVTLKKEYLDKLSSGEHTIKISFKDGEFAETKFNVEVKNVETGVNLGFEILTLIIISGIGYFLIRKKSKFPKHN